MQTTLTAPRSHSVAPIFTSLARRFEGTSSTPAPALIPNARAFETAASASTQVHARSPIFERLAGRTPR